MIFGHIKQIENAPRLYPTALARTLRYLAHTDFSHFENGSRHDIVKDKIFVTIAQNTTEPAKRRKPEVHRDYADIHLLLSGREQIGISMATGKYPIIEDYFEQKDIGFYEEKMPDDCQIYLSPGHFVFVSPGEIHRPLCAVDDNSCTIRKAIVKIAFECLL